MEVQNMAKAAIVKNYKLSAQGILSIDENGVYYFLKGKSGRKSERQSRQKRFL